MGVEIVNDAVPDGAMTGVRVGPDGQLDFSQAAIIRIPGQPSAGHDKTSTPHESDIPADKQEQARQRLDAVRSEALKAGVSETELKSWVNMARSNDRPMDRRVVFRSVTRGRDLEPEQALSFVLRYDKETTRAEMATPVFHYHQTGGTGFENIVRHGSVMSSEKQIEAGMTTQKSGSSRPDVVQFTRDSINRNKELVPGISMDVDMGKGGSVTLVFNESIMDDPSYDGATHYPNLPQASLDYLAAATVDTPEEIPGAQATLAAAGRQDIPVLTRREWINRYA